MLNVEECFANEQVQTLPVVAEVEHPILGHQRLLGPGVQHGAHAAAGSARRRPSTASTPTRSCVSSATAPRTSPAFTAKEWSEPMEPILVERRGRVGLVTLNRPEKLNALNSALVESAGAGVAASSTPTMTSARS